MDFQLKATDPDSLGFANGLPMTSRRLALIELRKRSKNPEDIRDRSTARVRIANNSPSCRSNPENLVAEISGEISYPKDRYWLRAKAGGRIYKVNRISASAYGLNFEKISDCGDRLEPASPRPVETHCSNKPQFYAALRHEADSLILALIRDLDVK